MSERAPGQPGIIERALELARRGPAENLEQIARQLSRENYSSVAQHMAGPSLRRQLTRLCTERLQRDAQRATAAQS